jgi:hypothetical protein
MDPTVIALRAAFATLLMRTPCIGRSPPEPVPLDSPLCADKDCTCCAGRMALRAYELGAPERMHRWLSVRAVAEQAERMAAVLSLYDRLVDRLQVADEQTQSMVEVREEARDVLKAYEQALALARAVPS